jgi:hypothetical protein
MPSSTAAPADLPAAFASLARSAHRFLGDPQASPAGRRELLRRVAALEARVGPEAPLARWLANVRRHVQEHRGVPVAM